MHINLNIDVQFFLEQPANADVRLVVEDILQVHAAIIIQLT